LDLFKNQDLEIFLLIIVISIIFIPVISLHADVSLNNSINISNDAADDSFDFQVSAAGSNVYVVWVKEDDSSGDFTLELKTSTNDGASFGSAVTLSAPTGGEFITIPEITSLGSKMYAVWEEEDSSLDPQIFFTNTTNNGATTFTKEDLSASTVSSFLPNIAVSGSNVYVVWEERLTGTDRDIFFMNSTDDGVTFDSSGPFNLSNDAIKSGIPQIDATGNNVHVVWYGDTGSSTSTISIRSSTNGASSFNPTQTLDTLATGLASALDIDIASSGSNVFVVWEDGNEIMFTNSTDAGATFDSGGPFNLSNSGSGTTSEHPRVSISGSNVYVTWEENTEIYLRTSTNLGSSFNSFVNLSADSGNSERPEIASSGNDVYVVWENFNSLTSSDDIFLRHSPDSGSTLCGISKITSDTNASTTPLISLSGSNVYTVWSDGGTPSEIGFRAGTTESTCVQFDATQYRTTDSAFITVDDPASVGDGTLPVTISSFDINNNPTTINVNLVETGPSTGTFTGTITFIESGSSSGSTLLVGPDKTVTLNAATASIFPRIVSFLLSAGGSDTNSYPLSLEAFLQVTDQNSDLTASVETITISVSSPSDSLTLDLVETGPSTGVFAKDVFVFNEDSSGQFPIDGTVTVTQSDPGGSPTGGPYSPTAIDKIDVTVVSNSEPTGVLLSLIETGVDTRDFERELTFSTATLTNSTLKVSSNDFISVTIFGETARGIIAPTNSSRGSLQAAVGNTITATFQGILDTVTISPGVLGGGGGGGIAVPGLVLNVLASLGGGLGFTSAPSSSLDKLILEKHDFEIPSEILTLVENHDPLIPIEPISIDKYDFDFPLSINENGFALGSLFNTIETVTVKTKEPVFITSVIYEESILQHVSMHMNLRGDTSGNINESDTLILYNKDKPLKLIDPNGYFESVDVVISEDHDALKYFANFEIVFAKPMEKSDIILRVWDNRLNSADTTILDAIEVFDKSELSVDDVIMDPEPGVDDVIMDPEPGVDDVIMDPEPGVDDVKKVLYVPEWIKNSVEMWSEGQMNDDTFIQGMQFLVQEQIIDIPLEANVSEVKDKNIRIFEEEKITQVPKWVKDNAGWWSEGLLSDDEFILAMEYLLKEGAMKI